MGNQQLTETLTPIKTAGALTNVEDAVLSRYREGAHEAQSELCCPINYDAKYLKLLPQELIEKDYGCGDPSAHVHAGERVLDLGSGGGKICYILSQKVGSEGSVIGVDFNDDMLALARKYQEEMREKLGYGNVSFKKGKIQDLSLDLERAQQWLNQHPIQSIEDLADFETECDALRFESPLIPDASVDVIVSNCVLNLVRTQDKEPMFKEMHRVLARGGRAVISDIVCDEAPTESIMNDPDLWSGCIAGAFREDHFLQMFEEAGFYGVEIIDRQEKPWKVIEGIEFRSLTVRAYKGKEGPCLERNEAVIYGGPWKAVTDDDGHTLHRGQRMAVCDKTYRIMTDPNGPYSEDIIAVPPRTQTPESEVVSWDSERPNTRHPRESKGLEYDLTTLDAENDCCGPAGC